MAETSDASTSTAERELVITRVFDAPRELVWKAWTDPELAKQWSGPRGFTAKDFSLDPRPGGEWHLTMHSPETGKLTNRGVVRDSVEPERLVFTFAWDNDDGTPGREMLITITFVERDGKTEMTFTHGVFESAEDRDGHSEGWNESFDKLADHLQTITGAR
jgi:uncharacterized protein YndB with AHSA1/START domain